MEFILRLILLNLMTHNLQCTPDWLISDSPKPTTLTKSTYGTIILSNGLISREFSIVPDFATIDFFSHEKETSLLRAINPEAVIGLNGRRYNVGGLQTGIPRAYLNRTDLALNATIDPDAFHFVEYETHKPVAPFPYTPMRGAPKDIMWPPKGLTLDVTFKPPHNAPDDVSMSRVVVHYEMYDGIPLLVKWISVYSDSPLQIAVTVYSVEYLAVNREWSYEGAKALYDAGWLSVDTDQPHGTQVSWGIDSQADDMPGSFEPVVNVTYGTDGTAIPAIPIPAVVGFESFRVQELVIGSSDPERSALARHRKMRLLAPHTQENPVFFHMVDSDSKAMRGVIDQMAEVGFEMLIYSFGSGFKIESDNETYIKQVAADIAYANSKGIEVGGYDLIALTRRSRPEWMAIDPQTMKPSGSSCFASEWYDYLMEKFVSFIEKTGLTMVETDGPYGGYACASTSHKHHKGVEDSIYMQNLLQGRFYKLLRKMKVYVNQPDNYFYEGGSRTGLGYNENQYSLPRWQDLTISRQDLYDDTYRLIPTAGWMFVPLVQYHGGGDPAIFELLSDHKVEYEWALAQYLGAGVAACYRGIRLYDSNETKAIVKKWVSFYKTYRDIIISDIIHVRRPDMQWIDSFMHVNHKLTNKGLALVFNPTNMHIKTNLTLPLYYTGLETVANIAEQGTNFKQYTLDREYRVSLPIDMSPLTITWFVIQ